MFFHFTYFLIWFVAVRQGDKKENLVCGLDSRQQTGFTKFIKATIKCSKSSKTSIYLIKLSQDKFTIYLNLSKSFLHSRKVYKILKIWSKKKFGVEYFPKNLIFFWDFLSLLRGLDFQKPFQFLDKMKYLG